MVFTKKKGPMMKRMFFIAILICASLLQQIRADVPSTRKALLVGVGNYPAGSGWHRLSSALDIEMLKGTLASTSKQNAWWTNRPPMLE